MTSVLRAIPPLASLLLFTQSSVAQTKPPPSPYKPDVFVSRKVEACAYGSAVAAFPVQGGRNWVLASVDGMPMPVLCSELGKTKRTPVPSSVFTGSVFEGWKVSGGADPERVGLLNGVPHRLVTVFAFGPLETRDTIGPCHEPIASVICEGTYPDGNAVAALREAEAELAKAEFQLVRPDPVRIKASVDKLTQLLELVESAERFDADTIIKTSDGGLQSKRQFDDRIGVVLDRFSAFLRQAIAIKNAAKKAAP